MKKKTILTLTILTTLLASCTNDSEADLVDVPNENTVTYTNYVKNVIDSNCLFCHGATPSNGAPMSLTTYSLVKDAVLNRGLLDRISRPQGSSGMMPNGGTRLPQTTIDAITKWQTDGLLE
ncbi:conserved exported hypothetical protein [Flavobacterium sp. 9AF]|uniref:hypothetical protein n=1 Tax=Flavobacterium sp. 9AF TaxID=2653142 RepID=UPI0012F0D3E9|nr:hypothetical protein [Flavobacterium sp. 9AF]VXB02020.1 conserved exported hypothetical protein [Flavobacterium sp. 9AF]